MSGYSSTNQGHCHPKIVNAMVEQATKVTQTSRAFHNTQMGTFAEYLCNLLGFDKYLPSSSGVEACESACKLARRWGYVHKKVEHNKASIIMANNCFWGRSITASGGSSDFQRYNNFGPFTPGFPLVDFNDLNQIEDYMKKDPNCVGIMLEPIQGEAGVIIPEQGYLRKVKNLCEKYNCLLITDEVQTGLGRTGKLMAYEWDLGDVKPDICTLGKALSGGVTPVSGIVGFDEVMMTIKPGDHGSTYGGNPLSMAAAHAAVKVTIEENLTQRSSDMGALLLKRIQEHNSDLIKDIRGRGLFQAIELHDDINVDGNDLCKIMMDHGLITKATHKTSVRLAPALVIEESEIHEAADIILKSID